MSCHVHLHVSFGHHLLAFGPMLYDQSQPLQSHWEMMMVPVDVLDRMGVAAVDVSVDVSASEALLADMDAEEEGGSEVDMMLGLGLDISIIELF
jgi:hypothetical protein